MAKFTNTSKFNKNAPLHVAFSTTFTVAKCGQTWSFLIYYLSYKTHDFSDNILTTGSTFLDVNSMVEALQSGNISSALLEMYVPVKRKDLFNNSWFVIKELLEAEISHGVLLQGAGVSKLAKEMKDLIKTNNVQTKYLSQQDDVVDQSEVRLIIPIVINKLFLLTKISFDK